MFHEAQRRGNKRDAHLFVLVGSGMRTLLVVTLLGGLLVGCSETKQVPPAGSSAASPGLGEPIGELASVDDFQSKVSGATGTAAVFVGSATCQACKRYTPEFIGVAKAHSPAVAFWHVDVDKAKPLADKLSVTMTPTTIIFANGVEKERIEGMTAGEDLEREIL